MENDGGFKFQISYDFAAHDVMLHQKKKIIEITMMITCCCPKVNDKRQPIPTTFIDTLFKIVRGRGLVRRSSANDHFFTVEITALRTASSDFWIFPLPSFFITTVHDQKGHQRNCSPCNSPSLKDKEWTCNCCSVIWCSLCCLGWAGRCSMYLRDPSENMHALEMSLTPISPSTWKAKTGCWSRQQEGKIRSLENFYQGLVGFTATATVGPILRHEGAFQTRRNEPDQHHRKRQVPANPMDNWSWQRTFNSCVIHHTLRIHSYVSYLTVREMRERGSVWRFFDEKYSNTIIK